MANITVSVTDANNITVQLTPVAAQNVTIDRGVAGNGISSIVPVTISTLQYLRIYYTNGTQQDVGPLTSTAYFGETPITIVGNTISLSTVPINKGGTNAITAAAAIQNLLPSYTGNGSKRLGLNSGATALEWVLDGGGTVTSVAVSGGTTGLTTSGGPITGSGTITLAGTLAVANGGTGVTTSTGTGSVVLSTSPSLVTPILGTPTSGNFSTGTFTWPTFNQNTTGTAAGLSATLVIASGGTNGTATPTAGAVPYGTGTAYAFTAAGTAGQILQSNGALAPTWANLSSLGVSSFSAGTTGFTPSTATTGAVTLAGTLNAVNGGTGQSSYAVGDLLYASSTTALSKLADVATGNALISGGVGVAPAWGKIALTTHVSGVLPTANGGTNLSSFTANGVVYASSTSALATNSALTFDGTKLQVSGSDIRIVQASNSANNGLYFRNFADSATFAKVAYEAATGNLQVGTTQAYDTIFLQNNAEAMRLTATGLGIGTSSPQIQSWRAGTYLTVANVSTRGQVEIDGAVADSSSASLGALIFTYSTNTTNHKDVALIEATSSGATANQRGGVLNFYTKANGTASPALNMALDSSGNLGVGTPTPADKLEVYSTITARASSGTSALRLRNTTSDYQWQTVAGTNAISLLDNAVGSSRLYIDSSGNLGLGVTPSAWATLTPAFQLGTSGAFISGQTGQPNSIYVGTNAYYNSGWKYINTSYASYYTQYNGQHQWYNAASGTAGLGAVAAGSMVVGQSYTIYTSGNTNWVASGAANNNVGTTFTCTSGSSGTGTATQNITFTQAMTLDASGNVMVGTTTNQSRFTIANQSTGYVAYTATDGTNISFFGLATQANNYITGSAAGDAVLRGTNGVTISGNNGTGAVRIDSSGTLCIGTTSALSAAFKTNIENGRLGVSSNSDQYALYLRYNTATLGAYIGSPSANALAFSGSGGGEYGRFDSSGNLLVGTTSFSNAGGGVALASGASGENLKSSATSTGAWGHYGFYNSNGRVGLISTNGTATTYATSSDYRLKHDIAPMTGALAKVSALKPVTYKWNTDNSDGEGFIAHELAAVVPQCVTGEKDAVDEEGNPVYQGIDTSFLVATLTAAIQEQQAIIQSLTARITALEGA